MYNKTIFVGIPSYRDPECGKTVLDLFKKAGNPERVFVGIFQQNTLNDIDVFDTYGLKKYIKQIKLLTISSENALGNCFARSKIQEELYEKEDYYLGIDSHMLFVNKWDEMLINEINLCPTPKKAILTCYPNDYDMKKRNVIPIELKPKFLSFRSFYYRNGFIQLVSNEFANIPSKPQRSLFWAGGFHFSEGRIIKIVSDDPSYKNTFIGDEIAMAIRFFTHGFDFYAPTSNIVFHLKDRTYRKTFTEYMMGNKLKKKKFIALRKKSWNLIKSLWKKPFKGESKYDVGSKRTIDELQQFIGIDLSKHVFEDRSLLGIYNESEEYYYKYGDRSKKEIVAEKKLMKKTEETKAKIIVQFEKFFDEIGYDFKGKKR